ncbi:hypothetical protein H9Q10_00130 [Eikenella sp. S3360]|uniref:Beta-carotene 15,15'-monooxygenase n=1 Tax=Eikenella glucosivorans TaxID=2766967 RepID=A0ABS0N704_9NEIS|nr:hypothetical protein [Eikenella glucosivorans]MBH5328084.1 hypothetical protein [Eikenella glucosivorans]
MPHTAPLPPQRHPAAAGLRWLKQACRLMCQRRLVPYLFGLTLLQIIGTGIYWTVIEHTPWQAWGQQHWWAWRTLHDLADSQIGLLLSSFGLFAVHQQQTVGQTDWRAILPLLCRRLPSLAGVWLLLFLLFYMALPNGLFAFLSEIRSLSPSGQFTAYLLIMNLLMPLWSAAFFLVSPLMLAAVPAKPAIRASLRAARANWRPILIALSPFWLISIFMWWAGSGLFAFDPDWYFQLDYILLPLLFGPLDPALCYLICRDIYPSHTANQANG